MKRIKKFFRKLKNEKGQGMTEYIIIVGLVAILLITAVTTFKGSLEKTFTTSATKIDQKITQPINNLR